MHICVTGIQRVIFLREGGSNRFCGQFVETSNNQRLANAGKDFFFAHLRTKRFGGL